MMKKRDTGKASGAGLLVRVGGSALATVFSAALVGSALGGHVWKTSQYEDAYGMGLHLSLGQEFAGMGRVTPVPEAFEFNVRFGGFLMEARDEAFILSDDHSMAQLCRFSARVLNVAGHQVGGVMHGRDCDAPFGI